LPRVDLRRCDTKPAAFLPAVRQASYGTSPWQWPQPCRGCFCPSRRGRLIERLSRFRVDRAKGNYSPAQAATWRQFVNTELANGDEVGVVAPWNFPGQGEETPERAAADQKADHVFLQLLDKFVARGANVSANAGPTYAPARFAEEREAKTAKVSKAALKGAMNRLLDAGRIGASRPAVVTGARTDWFHGRGRRNDLPRNIVDTSWTHRV
jgi:hypothetical protein